MSDVYSPTTTTPIGDAAELTAATASLVNAGTNVGVAIKNGQMADKNFELQQGWYEYQKALQQEIFNREDTAFARRVKDVTKAGFSPLAALGQSAGSGQVVSTTAPQHSGYQSPDLSPITQAASLINAAETSRLEREATEYNLNWYRERGLPTNSGMYERVIADVLGMLGTNINDLPEYLRNKYFGFVDDLTEGAQKAADMLMPPVADSETIKRNEAAVDKSATLNSEKPNAPATDLSGIKRYRDRLATWKKMESEMLSSYGDPAYSHYVEDWYKKNPRPKK